MQTSNKMSDFDPEVQNLLMQDQNLGHIPLLIVVKVPIRLLVDNYIIDVKLLNS